MKKQVTELAIFGGLPAFEEKLHVGRPSIGNRERLLERINDLLDRRWLINTGPYVQVQAPDQRIFYPCLPCSSVSRDHLRRSRLTTCNLVCYEF